MSFIQEELFRLADNEYADFQAKLAPTIDRETFIGVRVPELRKFAKVVQKHEECEQFLRTVPHTYYDENMLHSVLISGMKKYEECLEMLEMGEPMAECFKKNEILPVTFCRILDLGAKSGTSDTAMEEISRRLNDMVQLEVQRKVGKIEPTIVILTSVLVGLILIAVMLPLINIMSSIG